MATTHEAQTDFVPGLRQERQSLGKTVVSWLTSTDHKVIGYLYLITSVVFFLIGGILAMAMRLELWGPGMDLFQSKEQYNQFFTMHRSEERRVGKEGGDRGARDPQAVRG